MKVHFKPSVEKATWDVETDAVRMFKTAQVAPLMDICEREAGSVTSVSRASTSDDW